MQKLTVCVAALVGLMCGVADGSSATAKTIETAQVRVVGEGRPAPHVAQGGRGVPLRHALEQIVPPDFSINLPNAGPWADVPVSWHAHVPFVAALREALLTAPDVSADVDLKLRLVTVRANAKDAATSADAAFAMKHVWGLPPNRDSSNVAAQPPSMEPAVGAQPPLLAAMRSAQPVAPATKEAAMPTVTAGAPAFSNAPLTQPAAKPAGQAASSTLPVSSAQTASVASPASARAQSAAANTRAVVTTTAEPTPATATSTDAIGDPLPASPPPEPVKEWHLALSDHTVKTALTRWAKEDGWQIVWDVPIDFGVDADATVTGTFEQALQAVVDALKKSETPIQAILYRGNKVLRIVAKGAA